MPNPHHSSGYFRNGMPYNRIGRGPRPLVIFQGLTFENKPQSAITIGWYAFLKEDYTVYVVLRKPGLPRGYTLQDMAGDYAEMIREELGGPLDVIGVSTGGSIAQHFAAAYPELVRRLVIHSSAYTLSEDSKEAQRRVAEYARQRRWFKANATLYGPIMANARMVTFLRKPMVWLISALSALDVPEDPNDMVVTIEAEDQFNFKGRLAQITAPTLVVAGANDPFATPELFRETAAGIPNARLILYEGMGHPAFGKQFAKDVLAFLREDRSP